MYHVNDVDHQSCNFKLQYQWLRDRVYLECYYKPDNIFVGVASSLERRYDNDDEYRWNEETQCVPDESGQPKVDRADSSDELRLFGFCDSLTDNKYDERGDQEGHSKRK